VLQPAEQAIPNALAPMETSTVTTRLSSRLAVLTVLETVAMLDSSVLRMLKEEVGAVLMYVSPQSTRSHRPKLTTPGNVPRCMRCRIQFDGSSCLRDIIIPRIHSLKLSSIGDSFCKRIPNNYNDRGGLHDHHDIMLFKQQQCPLYDIVLILECHGLEDDFFSFYSIHRWCCSPWIPGVSTCCCWCCFGSVREQCIGMRNLGRWSNCDE
jgi:hypothetical protein